MTEKGTQVRGPKINSKFGPKTRDGPARGVHIQLRIPKLAREGGRSASLGQIPNFDRFFYDGFP